MEENKEESEYKNNEIDIYLFSNGQQYSPPRKYHLRYEDLNYWESTLSFLARSHYGSLHSVIHLYELDGRQVESSMEIRDCAVYVAVVPPDAFIYAGYDKYLVKASRSFEKRLSKKTNGEQSNSGEQTSQDAAQLPKCLTVIKNNETRPQSSDLRKTSEVRKSALKSSSQKLTEKYKPIANLFSQRPNVPRKFNNTSNIAASKINSRRDSSRTMSRIGATLAVPGKSSTTDRSSSQAKPPVKILSFEQSIHKTDDINSNIKAVPNTFDNEIPNNESNTSNKNNTDAIKIYPLSITSKSTAEDILKESGNHLQESITRPSVINIATEGIVKERISAINKTQERFFLANTTMTTADTTLTQPSTDNKTLMREYEIKNMLDNDIKDQMNNVDTKKTPSINNVSDVTTQEPQTPISKSQRVAINEMKLSTLEDTKRILNEDITLQTNLDLISLFSNKNNMNGNVNLSPYPVSDVTVETDDIDGSAKTHSFIFYIKKGNPKTVTITNMKTNLMEDIHETVNTAITDVIKDKDIVRINIFRSSVSEATSLFVEPDNTTELKQKEENAVSVAITTPPSSTNITNDQPENTEQFLALVNDGDVIDLKLNIQVRNAEGVLKTMENIDIRKPNSVNKIKSDERNNPNEPAPHLCCQKDVVNECPCCNRKDNKRCTLTAGPLNLDQQGLYVLVPVAKPGAESAKSRTPTSDSQMQPIELPTENYVNILTELIKSVFVKISGDGDKVAVQKVSSVVQKRSQLIMMRTDPSEASSRYNMDSKIQQTAGSTQDQATQTDWCDLLLEARAEPDGHYTFHLPPLQVLREYTFR